MYAFVEQKLMAGDIIILDGGTGTDIQRRGVPMDRETWCAEANLTHPDVVRAVHCDYIRAGAEMITANTFATSAAALQCAAARPDIARIDRAAVRLAREAVEEAADGARSPVAGSFSTMRPVVAARRPHGQVEGVDAKEAEPLLHAKAEDLAEAGCDLIIMEMMRDVDYSLWATEAAVATGLPVWVGISVERRDDRRLAGFGRGEWIIEDIVATLMATGAKACRVMHTAPDDTDGGPGARANTTGRGRSAPIPRRPLQDAGLAFFDIIPAEDLVARPALAAGARPCSAAAAALGRSTLRPSPRRPGKADVVDTYTGSCLCGAVRFEVSGTLGRWSPATACNAASRPATTCRRPPQGRTADAHHATRSQLVPLERHAPSAASAAIAARCCSGKAMAATIPPSPPARSTARSGCRSRATSSVNSAGDYYEIAGGRFRTPGASH